MNVAQRATGVVEE